jgi:acyl-coenzyme A synthetase/AMP-(fatty) acid ligase
MTLRLIDDLQDHARNHPHALAALPVGDSWGKAISYAELHQQVLRLAAMLRDQLPVGATVLLCGPNRPSYLTHLLAVLAAGNTVFPIAADSAGPELASAAQRSGAAAAIVADPQEQLLQPFFRTNNRLGETEDGLSILSDASWTAFMDRGPGLLLQSSGTTDQPKIVFRDGASLDAVCRAMVNACRFTTEDHVLAAVPLCHSYGLEHGLLAPITAGSCVHVCEKFDLPAVLNELRNGGITMLPGVPFMFDMLARADQAVFPSLQSAYSAGGPLPHATLDAFQSRFGLRLGQVYGATEIGSVTFNDPASGAFQPASVGAAMDGVDIRVLDTIEPRIDAPLAPGIEGQVAVFARSMMCGYVDGDPAPLLDGYYLTGDLGTLNSKGALSITGRLKLLIDVGGRKVNPAEVESVLRQHPAVASCVVVPLRLSETVCRVKAIVTPRDAASGLTPQELRAFARERLSAYKVPRLIELREAMPLSPAGKILRSRVEAS